ncbi:hypothetical protein JK359_05630 [Streptomyces actinomycinicus]|uniref:Uncharacterized protein n=1 Tax=Streptomyces actinomycinicus TaxID=1695166 RepID=A0A937JNH4_9ACTN|nr:hypothetical protein [Streptomyces actinomycinicus]MBL1081463.1 hypothetical protein [Streptomyces actinomycinicus]
MFGRGDRENYFSGYGSRVLEIPKELRGRAVIVEAWGWLGSGGGFQVVGVNRPGGRYTEKTAGESGAMREKAHILLGPGECDEVRIIRGWKMQGRWKVRFVDAMSVGPLPPKAQGGASRFFRCPAPGARISAEFGDAGGRLGIYDERGRCIRVLAGRGHRFDDVVTVPDVQGVLAVEGPELKWGPMTAWSLRTGPDPATD